jgi:membrane protein
MNAKMLWGVSKGAFHEFVEDKVTRLSAALAYYALFSMAPLVIIVISIAGLFFGEQAVTGQMHDQLSDFFGDQGAQTIESMMSAARKPSSSIIASIIGIVTLLIGATGVFGQLQDALNTIWEVQPKPGRGIKGFIKDRFLSLTMVLGIGFLLLISMVLSAGLAAFTGVLNNRFGLPPAVAHSLNIVVSMIVISLLFAMIFKFLPDVKIKWRDVWFGAIFTAFLFELGKFLLGFYLGRATTASAYGAAGSLVIVLMWVYYSSLILFFGAEVTQAYTKARGSQLVPSANAVPVTEAVRANEGIPHEAALASARQRDPGSAKEPVSARNRGSAPRQISAPTARALATHRASATVPAEQPDPEALHAWEHIPKGSEVIQKKPWPFLSAAVGLGMLTGWLFKGEWLGHRKARSH